MSCSLWRFAILGLLLTACDGGGADGPPKILYGEDVCDRCRMVISEERHAGGAVIDGREYRFDDPGCLRVLVAEQPAGVPVRLWVHDETSSWRVVEEAWFVRDPEGATPMGSGILAYSSREAAEVAGAEARRWAELGTQEEAPTGQDQRPERRQKSTA